jgi:GT2 family glycosyltransferase
VLTYNGRDDTLDCLASLSHARWSALSLIVVDNGSHDCTTDAVAERFPNVRVLRQEQNLGFAEGNNVGIRHALELGADYVFLLNNDTTIAADAIARCVEVAQQHPSAGAVCPIIYFSEPRRLIWYAGAVFEPRRAHSGRMLGYREMDGGQFDHVGQTDRAAGAAVLLPRAVLEQVGLLDPALFFLYEDVDWSLRARRAGHRIYVAPKAKVWHRVSATAGGEHAPMIGYYDTRNHVVICRRYAPSGGVSRLRRELAILLVHLAGARRAPRRLDYLHGVLRGWRDARRGRLGPWRDPLV